MDCNVQAGQGVGSEKDKRDDKRGMSMQVPCMKPFANPHLKFAGFSRSTTLTTGRHNKDSTREQPQAGTGYTTERSQGLEILQDKKDGTSSPG